MTKKVGHSTFIVNYSQFKKPVPVRGISLVIRPNYSRMECVRAIVASVRKSISDIIS